MNNQFLRNLQFLLVVLDLLAINAVFFTVKYFFRDHLHVNSEKEYFYFASALNFLWLLVSLAGNIYHQKNIVSFELFSKRTMRGYLFFLGGVICYLFFFRQFLLSRALIITVLSIIPVALLLNRFLYLGLYHYYKKKDYLVTKVVVVGYNRLSKKLVAHLEEKSFDKQIVGFCEDFRNIQELTHYPVLSNVDEVVNVCKKHGATEIYSTITPEQHPEMYELISSAEQNCIRFKFVPDINLFINRKVHFDNFKDILVISLRNEPLADLNNKIKKRFIDILISSFVCIFILSWLIPLVGILIWLESRGPIFFIQQRSGKDNKIFQCLKFRSMMVNEVADLKQATKNDVRITRIGRFLRRTSLDEFPQFINVIRGQMSLVGPRPHMLKHTDEYSQLIRQFMVRHFLKPGITGWAQINGFRGETRTVVQMQKRVEHDLWYLENWSMWLDVKIIFMTVLSLFKKEENVF